MQINYNNYEYFLAIADCGSITKAAAQLYISQPSLTKYLKRLEENLGVELLDHRKKPLSLTEEGRAYYDYLKKLKKMDAQLSEQFSDIKKRKSKEITIAMGSYFSAYILPQILLEFNAKYPDVKVRILAGDDPFIYSAVIEERAQLGVLFAPQNYRNIDYSLILNEKIFLFGTIDHPAIQEIYSRKIEGGFQKEAIDLALLSNETFFIPDKGLMLGTLTQRAFRYYNIKPQNTVTVPTVQSGVNMAMSGHGFCVVPASFIKSSFYTPNCAFFPLCEPHLSCPLGVVYRKSDALSGYHLLLAEYIRNYFCS